MSTPRILVVGAGAVGGYFGGRLAQMGRDVTFLVRSARARALREQGLQIQSQLGNVRLEPRLVLAGEIDEPYDVIFLCLKAYALDRALDEFAPAVGPQSTILPVLNGLRHIDRLTDRFGDDRVIGGLCRVAVQLNDGRIEQLSALQQISYGELDGAMTPRLAEIDRIFQGAGFDASASNTIVQDLWNKWIQLAGLGALNCLFNAPIGAIARVPDGPETVNLLWRECVNIATVAGHPPDRAFAATMLAQFQDPASALTSSMYRDKKAGGPVEVEAILGDLVARGRVLNVAVPLLQAATVALRIYAAARASEAD